MALEVVWTKSAVADLEAIAEYISKDSTAYAASFVRSTLQAAASLSHFSRRGRTVPEYSQPEVRELILGPYRLIYKVSPQAVHVLAVIHGARRLR